MVIDGGGVGIAFVVVIDGGGAGMTGVVACAAPPRLGVPVIGRVEIAGKPVLPPTAAGPAAATAGVPAAPAPVPARATPFDVEGVPGVAAGDEPHAAAATISPATKAPFRTTFIVQPFANPARGNNAPSRRSVWERRVMIPTKIVIA
jgi:hypothetical protein